MTKVKEIKIKALEEEGLLTFEGYLSTYGNVDRDGDVFIKGAFKDSIAKKSTVPLCHNHNRSKVIGMLELSDTDEGVYTKGTLNAKDPFVVNEIYPLLKMGALDSMSVGFLTHEYEPIDVKRPFGGWNIKRAEAVEGSIVTVPANEIALIESVKGEGLSDDERAELYTLREEKRLGRVNELIEQAQGLLDK